MNILSTIIYHLSQPRFRLFKTIYINFKLLPFKVAKKFPIYIYGPVKIHWLEGRAKINSEKIYRGMIKLGRNNEFFCGVDRSSFISIQKGGNIIFNGPCAIANNYILRVSSTGTLVFGAYTFFGGSLRFVCTNRIEIGDYTRIAYESQLVDTNSHFTINSEGIVSRRLGPITIGKYNWIGNRTTISKGTKTKDYTIITSGSLVNKDFTSKEGNNQLLGGMPAKILGVGIKRIFSTHIEKEISDYFKKNPDQPSMKYEKEIEDDMSDIEYWFHKIM